MKTSNLTMKDVIPLLGLAVPALVTYVLYQSFSAQREFTVGNAFLPGLIPIYAALLLVASDKQKTFTITQGLSWIGGVAFLIFWMIMGDTSIWTNTADWALTWADPLLNLMTELLGSITAGVIGATQT